MIKKYFILFGFILLSPFALISQNLSQQEVSDYTNECHDLVAYLEFSLNSIGENDLSPKEKDIIISKSYAKLFRDSKVQIEDDLVPDREAITNKDVQAYLKDVDFFFEQVTFSYKILSVDLLQDESDHAYFKIQTLRTLKGNNINKDSIYNEQLRFIEVALNPDLRDLKIVSIYTTKINETEENIAWWNNLPISWKEILGKNESIAGHIEFSRVLNIQSEFILIEALQDTIAYDEIELDYCDSLGMDFNMNQLDTLLIASDSTGNCYKEQVENALNRILSLKELDLSNKLYITQLAPLNKLTELHTLNISGTLVNDLYPIRNLVDLQDLNISNSQVNNLDALIYSMALQNINLSNTSIYSLEAIRNLIHLRLIDISNTHIDDIYPLAGLINLSDIKMQSTMVTDLEPLAKLYSLNYLSIDNSPISDISNLSALPELKILSCNNTMINSLKPLSQLNNLNILYCENTEILSLKPLDKKPNLSKIYCDNTLLGEEKALKFMNDNPHVLVVYESRKLKKWFYSLSQEWQLIFSSYVDINLKEPTKEQLHHVASISKIDISGNKNINSLEPLARIQNLKILDAHSTNISSVEALSELRELDKVDLSHTKITSISSLRNLYSLDNINLSNTKIENLDAFKSSPSLKKLNIESTLVNDLSPILKLTSLRELKADNTKVDDKQFENFIIENPKCIVLYQSNELKEWWKDLNSVWTQFYMSQQGWNKEPDNIKLHHLAKQEKLNISNNRDIKDISSLKIFKFIKDLTINGTQVSNISILADFTRLKTVDLSQNPIENIDILGNIKSLNSIRVSNTPIDQLDWITPLTHLQFLDISGTQIKKLKSLSSLYMLETLIAYNTRISKLSDIDELVSLRSLKIYNTKLSMSKVNKFKILILPALWIIFRV